jgi:VWFA-related protein
MFRQVRRKYGSEATVTDGIELRLRCWLAFWSFCLFGVSLSLEGQQLPTFPAQVKVVNLLATVEDKHGKIVSNLTKDDFTLNQDGHPQTIRYFAKETDLPLTLGLLVDTSMSQRRVLDQERSASHDFLDQVLRVDKDKAFVIHFDRQVELLQDLTSSRDKLYNALGLLETPQSTHDSGGNSPDAGTDGRRGWRGGGTLLYDAVYLASNELMSKQQGRKAIIVLSDGVDRGSKESLGSAVEAAQRADTIVYSILFKDDQAYSHNGGFSFPGMGGGGMGRHGGGRYPQEPRPDGKKVLEQISHETGGELFEVSKKQSISQIYSSIQEELRNLYNLGYTPDKADASAGYHKILLTTKQKDLIVRTRDGYYAND